MSRTKRLLIPLLLLIPLGLMGAGFYLYQQLQANGIQALKIEIDTLSLQRIHLKNLSLRYSPPPKIQQPSDSTVFFWPQDHLQWQISYWLPAWLPHNIIIENFVIELPCQHQTCLLQGNMQFSQSNRDANLYQLSGKLTQQTTQDTPHPILQTNTLPIDFNVDYQTHPNQPVSLKGLLSMGSLQLAVQTHLTTHQQWNGDLAITGQYAHPAWQAWLNPWLNKPSNPSNQNNRTLWLDNMADEPLPIQFKAMWQFGIQNWPDFKLWQQQFTGQLQLNANVPSLINLAGLGKIQGLLQADLSADKGQLQSYHLLADGLLADWPMFQKFAANGLNIPQMAFHLNSTTRDALPLTNLPFELALSSPPTSPPSKSGTQFKLTSQGNLNLTAGQQADLQATIQATNPTPGLNLTRPLPFDQLAVHIEQGQLDLTQDKLQAGQSQWQNLTLNLPFKAQISAKQTNLNIDNANLKSNLYLPAQNLTLKQSQLQLQQITLHMASQDYLPNQITLNAKQVKLSTQPQYASKDASFASRQFTSELKQLNIIAKIDPPENPTQPIANRPVMLTLQTDYQLEAKALKHARLLTQDWSAQGQINGSLALLKFSGKLLNSSGLQISHQSQWTPNLIKTHWQTQPIYFMAGNPLAKTFIDWPRFLTFASGKTALNGQLSLNPNTKSSLLASLQATTVLKLSDLSGIYNQTAISNFSSDANLQLDKGQIELKVPQLKVDNILHGVSAGPILISAAYQAPIQALTQGVLSLSKFNSGLFNGQVWLAPQTINLAKPFTLELHLTELDIEDLLKQYPTEDLAGNGRLSGRLPIFIDLKPPKEDAASNQQADKEIKPLLTIQNGLVESIQNGGKLQYRPSGKIAMAQSNVGMKLILDVLDDFHYSLLSSTVSYDAKGKLTLALKLQGKNPGFEKGRAINLNVNLEEELPALITSMQINNQVSEIIKRRVQEKLLQKK